MEGERSDFNRGDSIRTCTYLEKIMQDMICLEAMLHEAMVHIIGFNFKQYEVTKLRIQSDYDSIPILTLTPDNPGKWLGTKIFASLQHADNSVSP